LNAGTLESSGPALGHRSPQTLNTQLQFIRVCLAVDKARQAMDAGTLESSGLVLGHRSPQTLNTQHQFVRLYLAAEKAGTLVNLEA